MKSVDQQFESEVWVWLARDREGALAPQAYELLYEAGGLCRRFGAGLIALGDRAPSPVESDELARWGVTKVRHLGAPIIGHPQCAGGHDPLALLAGAVPPRVVLFPDDTAGKVLAPLWAAANDATLVTGATSVTGAPSAAGGERLVVSRPTFGDQHEALVTVDGPGPLAVILLAGSVGDVRPPVRAIGEPPAVRAAPAAEPVSGTPGRVLPPDPATLDVADAERIVAFGRGAFSEEALALVRRLAELLGAALAGSRPAADEGWIPFARQVGLTGAIVRPRLYVAIGISGAPYHMVGIKDPGTLIAINRDPDAPIFGSADLGIVGDLFQVLPALIARLERGQAPAALQVHAAPRPPAARA